MSITLQNNDLDICDLLQTMNIGDRWTSGCEKDGSVDSTQVTPQSVRDTLMESDDLGYQSDTSESSSSTSSDDSPCGCAMLQTIRSQFDHYQTTGGEYLEVIFMHRESFNAFPRGHQSCARGFSDLASVMEQRAWRADRDADAEAVAAFRYEAWMIAAYL